MLGQLHIEREAKLAMGKKGRDGFGRFFIFLQLYLI